MRVPPELCARLTDLAHAALPAEACGLLLGHAGCVEALLAVRNVAASPVDAFELDPGDVVAAEQQARAHGLEIVGVWHSHPRGEAEPSEADRRGVWSGWEQLIVAPRAERVLRAWRASGPGFVERELV